MPPQRRPSADEPPRIPSPFDDNKQVDDEAIQAANLRLEAAQKWVDTSQLMLERAQAQVISSQKELQDAKEYLARLKNMGKGYNNNDETHNNSNTIEDEYSDALDDIKLMSNLSDTAVSNNYDKEEEESVAVINKRYNESRKKSVDNSECGNTKLTQAESFSVESNGSEDKKEENSKVAAAAIVTSSSEIVTAIDNDNTSESSLGETEKKQSPVEESSSDVVAAATTISTAAAVPKPSPISSVVSLSDSEEHEEEEKEDDNDYIAPIAMKRSLSDSSLGSSSLSSPRRKIESYDEFLSAISESSDKTFEDEDAIDTLIKKCESVMESNEVQVTGCGVSQLNGVYSKFAESDGVPTYCKIAKIEGKEVMCNISRWQCNNGTRKWYLTATEPGGGSRAKQLAFYVAYAPSFFNKPPRKNWMKCVDGEELFLSPEYKMCGIDPAPIMIIESDDASVSRRNLGRQISSAFSTGSSRSRRRRKEPDIPSLSSLESEATAQSKNRKVPTSVYLPPSLLER